MRMSRLLGMLFKGDDSVAQYMDITATASQINIPVTGIPKGFLIHFGVNNVYSNYIRSFCVALYDFDGTTGYFCIGTADNTAYSKLYSSSSNPIENRISNGILTLTKEDFVSLTTFYPENNTFYTGAPYKVVVYY